MCLECVWICLESVRESLDSVLGGLKSYQLKKLQCLSPYSTSPFYPGGLQWAKNAQKGEIENRPWPYFFSQLDPMLFRIFSLKLIKETPCGHQPVNSNFEFYHPPLSSAQAQIREKSYLLEIIVTLFQLKLEIPHAQTYWRKPFSQ